MSIAVLVEAVHVMKVDIILYALPDIVGGVGFFLWETVGTKKNIAWIDQILHKHKCEILNKILLKLK